MGLVLSAHQPTFASYLGTLAKIAQADLFCIFDCVPFSRHDYANRVKIKTQRGAEWLTVPVEHGQPLLKDARIIDGPWRRKHLRALELAYHRAPYFQQFFTALSSTYEQRYEKLADLNRALMLWMLAAMDINTRIVRASDYDFQGSKSALVLDMCIQLGASKYIFGPMGRSYADVLAFEAAGIEVEFQQFTHPVYAQLHGEFVPNLSALDLLMNHGPQSREILRNGV